MINGFARVCGFVARPGLVLDARRVWDMKSSAY